MIPFPNLTPEQKKEFARNCFEIILSHFKKREEDKALSIIVPGASFEQWMSFEARLALENSRDSLVINKVIDMTEEIISETNSQIPRYWTKNEHGKVDLLIGQCWGYTENGEKYYWDEGKIAFEFKIIHNNKNWRGKVESIWIDLCDPPWGKLTNKLELENRYAIVAVIFKTYPAWITNAGGYPGQIPEENKKEWTYQMETYLNECDQNKKLNIIKRSKPIIINDPFLIGTNNTITFYLLNAKDC